VRMYQAFSALFHLCDSDTFQFIAGLCSSSCRCRTRAALPVSTLCGFNPSALDKVFCIVVVLVGAVGIENNDERNFKDLRGMTRNAKSLKKNDEACRGILIAPSKLPRFSRSIEIPTAWDFRPRSYRLRPPCFTNYAAKSG
jgi:hypothetical protein